jgi:rhodanese-related sulfurtransferase
MKILASAAVAVLLVMPQAVQACEEHAKQAKSQVKKLSVGELAMLTKENKAVVLDANGDQTRAQMGVIPGARLLTSSVKYDLMKELPAAKTEKLVFYCASEKCSASKQAAERAASAGYVDVNILPAGIKGWKDAGQPTVSPGRS